MKLSGGLPSLVFFRIKGFLKTPTLQPPGRGPQNPPARDRHTETVFFLVKDILRKDSLHGFFEDEALFKTPHLQRRRDAPGKLSQPVIEQRKARAYAGHLSGAKHLAEVIVGQSHLDVEIEQPVQIVFRHGGTKVFLGNVQPGLRRSALQQTQLEYFLRRSTQQKMVGKNTPREWNVGSPNVAPRQTETALILREQRGDRFDESLAEPSGHMLIESEASVGRVTLVAGEEFVAAVTREQCSHAGFARHASTVVGTDGGRVREGLVVILHDLRNGVVCIAGGQAKFVVVGAEMLGWGAGKTNFAVNRFGKKNR